MSFCIVEVVMKYFIWNWVSVFALLVLPLGGCGSSTTNGTGGAAGTGGVAGTGGTGGGGGTAGTGGTAGGGGSAAIPAGVWTGTGTGGSGGSFDICFAVNEDGTALTLGADSEQRCEFYSLEVAFTGCVGSLSYKPDIPIEDGFFELLDVTVDIKGTFDGNTASGEATLIGDETCSSQWEATPNE